MTSSSTTATAVRPPPRPLNANVRAVYQFMFLRSVYSSLFPQTPLSYYVLLCTGSNTKVGLVQGIQGIVNLCTGFPFAVLGDRWRRESVLRLSAAVGCVAVALTLVVLLVVEGAAGSHSSLLFGCLCGVMAVWGVFMGSLMLRWRRSSPTASKAVGGAPSTRTKPQRAPPATPWAQS